MLVFVFLQIADIISTLVFLSLGVQEANPLIRALFHWTNPLAALVIVKIAGVGIGVLWYLQGYKMRPVNIVFSLLIVWNLIAIALSPR
jgi:hypothetical protein